MKNGKFEYYVIQHKKTHESPWLKTKEPLVKVRHDWAFSSWEYFGFIAEPWTGSGNDWKPKHKKSHDETYDVWNKTDERGWWTLKFAEKAVRRLEKAQKSGKFDTKGPYGKKHQVCRYKFRIVKKIVSHNVEVVEISRG